MRDVSEADWTAVCQLLTRLRRGADATLVYRSPVCYRLLRSHPFCSARMSSLGFELEIGNGGYRLYEVVAEPTSMRVVLAGARIVGIEVTGRNGTVVELGLRDRRPHHAGPGWRGGL